MRMINGPSVSYGLLTTPVIIVAYRKAIAAVADLPRHCKSTLLEADKEERGQRPFCCSSTILCIYWDFYSSKCSICVVVCLYLNKSVGSITNSGRTDTLITTYFYH